MCARLKQEFTAMTEEALLFQLPKFVADIRKSDGSPDPPNSVHQVCCGLSRALKSANGVDIDMFNSPKLLSSEIFFLNLLSLLWYCYCCFLLMHCCMCRFS